MEASPEVRLAFLEKSRESHFKLASLAAIAGVRMDTILAWMVLKRSLSLVFGYTSLIRSSNFVSAVPLIRMQIDNLLRFRAAFLAPDISEFVASVIEGAEIRELRDADDHRMTDHYLQRQFAMDYPWLESLYRSTSGYIHLSDAHFANAIRAKPGGERQIEAYIGPDDKMISPQIYAEATENMIRATYELLSFMEAWAKSVAQGM
jgi:hypothetical protein